MAGTKSGASKATAKILARDPDHFKKIGAKGGRNGNTGGFASGLLCDCGRYPEPHKYQRCAGAKGGYISRRGKAKKVTS